jgi:uncharacterized phage-associated protein
MTVSASAAARRLCERTGWSLSNNQLQQILYIAHMVCLGQHGEPLIEENFEARENGPVIPSLQRQLRLSGPYPTKNLFHSVDGEIDARDAKVLDHVVGVFARKKAGQLEAITRWDKGAWSKHSGAVANERVIPNSEIAEEFRDRRLAVSET